MSPPIRRFPLHTWVGLAILIGAELGVAAGNRLLTTWLTPIAWTGTILVVDGCVRRVRGVSWLTTRAREAPFLFLASIGIWLMFEAYNFHLRNWAYLGVPPNPLLRDLAYAWSFSTIAPAVFEIADFVEIVLGRRRKGGDPALAEIGGPRSISILAGLSLVIVPLTLPSSVASYLFGAVWIGFIFLVDPINERLGARSLRRLWKSGDRSQVFSLLLAGLICGFLWETWNYQAMRAGGAYWVYTIPDALRVFGLHFGQMPVLGLLGFPPFALELSCLYTLFRTLFHLDRGIGSSRGA
jgi:hypothetical protein